MTKTITSREWNIYKRHGYTSERDGKKFILALDHATGATVLQEVRIALSAHPFPDLLQAAQ